MSNNNKFFSECPQCIDKALEDSYENRIGFISSTAHWKIGVLMPISNGSVVIHNWICNRCDYKLLYKD